MSTSEDRPVSTNPPADGRRDPMRLTAAAVCALHAVVLLGFCGFYLWELTQGGSDDAARVVMSAVLIGVFAVALGALARAWLSGADWPNTPTIVWSLLMVPVAIGLFQGGRGLIGALVALVALVGLVAAGAARADTMAADQDGSGR